MMTAFLLYQVKVALLLGAFYVCFRVLLSREKFHTLNRVVMLLTIVLSLVLPLCVLTFHKVVVMDTPQVGTIGIDGMMIDVATVVSTPLWQIALSLVYIIGVAVCLFRTLYAILSLNRLISHCQHYPYKEGVRLAVTDQRFSPFNWMRTIVLSREDYEQHDEAILAHEMGHVRRLHSLDVLLMEMLTAMQWFNPVVWMMRQDLRDLHEYEADQAVLSQGFNALQYLQVLIQKAEGYGGYSIANGINHSTLKNRVKMMMNNKKTSRFGLLKVLALIPIVGTALVLNAETVTDVVYTDKPQKQIVKKGRANKTVKLGKQDIKVEKESIVKPEGESIEVTGIVTSNEDGKPIIGAIVKIEGSTRGTVTDREGRFSIKAKTNDVIQFSYVGYETCKFLMPPDVKLLESSPAVLDIQLFKEGAAPTATGTFTPVTDTIVPTATGTFTPNEKQKPFDVVEQMPQFPGGPAALMQFLSENIRYPKEAHDAGEQGRVIVTFVVGKDGSISDAKVVKSVSELLDAEAIRVINSMPKWESGKQNGKVVDVKYTVPITFSLQDNNQE